MQGNLKYSFKQLERLKSKTAIDLLFERKIFVQNKIIRIYFNDSIISQEQHQFAFVVAKKKFAKATDRNRIKRLMREAVRLQKHELNTLKPLQIIVQYRANTIEKQEQIKQSIHQLFLKISAV